MLVEFKVQNFLSFRDLKTFSMVASSSIKEHKNNVFTVSKKPNLLKSAAIYGANASGKSNLIRAIGFMQYFIIHSSKDTQIGEKIRVTNFLLNRSQVHSGVCRYIVIEGYQGVLFFPATH